MQDCNSSKINQGSHRKNICTFFACKWYIFTQKTQITERKDCNCHDCCCYNFFYSHLLKIILFQKIPFQININDKATTENYNRNQNFSPETLNSSHLYNRYNLPLQRSNKLCQHKCSGTAIACPKRFHASSNHKKYIHYSNSNNHTGNP